MLVQKISQLKMWVLRLARATFISNYYIHLEKWIIMIHFNKFFTDCYR